MGKIRAKKLLVSPADFHRKRAIKGPWYTSTVANIEHVMRTDRYWRGAIQLQVVDNAYRWVWMKDNREVGVKVGDFLIQDHFDPVAKSIASSFGITASGWRAWFAIRELTLHDPDYPGVKRKQEDLMHDTKKSRDKYVMERYKSRQGK